MVIFRKQWIRHEKLSYPLAQIPIEVTEGLSPGSLFSSFFKNKIMWIGFAIPSDTVKREIADLIEFGDYKHPWLGIRALEVNIAIANAIGLEKPQGILVIEVTPDSPADLSGLRGGEDVVQVNGQDIALDGDVIISVNDISVITMADLVVYMERNTIPGDSVVLGIIRDAQETSLTVTLGERP